MNSIKGRSVKFRIGSRVRQTSEEGLWTHQPKRCGNNNKDQDYSPKTLNDKNKFIVTTSSLGELMVDQILRDN